MNVMKRAHQLVNQKIVECAASGADIRTSIGYRKLLSFALVVAHKEFKEMKAQQTKKIAITCQDVIIHDLKEGDEVLCHGAIFRIKNRKEWANHHGTDPKDGTVVSWETDLVWHPDFCKAKDDEPYDPFPLSWARNYGLQSNRLMTWAKIVERPAMPKEKKF